MRHRDLDDESLEAFTGRGNSPSVGQIDRGHMVARPASAPGMIHGMPQRSSTAVGAPRRPTRLLIVTNMYPTPDRPQTGPFVALRVAALRELSLIHI